MTNALADAPAAPDQTIANYAVIPRDQLNESPKNPRKHFDPAKLQELANSIREHGVLTPLLARPDRRVISYGGKGPSVQLYELAAGHRRFRAAKIAGLTELPVVVREMTDTQLLEILTIENLQRDDVHPLEEAQGYHDLIKDAGYDAQRIAERVGKSVKYVYDRIKLLQLVPDAKKLFLSERITAGHAILLARLKKEDQERAIDPGNSDYNGSNRAALWQHEAAQHHPLFESDESDPYDGLKARSVRELEAWIEDHVRLDLKRDRDALVFPEIAEVVLPAKEMNLKVIPITYEHVLKDDARSDDERTYGPQSWERADGKHDSKTCEYSVTGYIAAGAGRGEAFAVCIAKEKCKTHWKEHVKRAEDRKRAAKKGAQQETAKPSASAAEKAERERKAQAAQAEKEKADAQRQAAAQLRFKKALPQILDGLAEHLGGLSASPSGTLADIVIDGVRTGFDWHERSKAFKLADAHISKGRTAEDFVRYLAFAITAKAAIDPVGYAQDDLTKGCKEIGFDVKKALDEISPIAKAEPKAAKKKARR